MIWLSGTISEIAAHGDTIVVLGALSLGEHVGSFASRRINPCAHAELRLAGRGIARKAGGILMIVCATLEQGGRRDV
ncbi:MAG: hypothetical protein OXE05_10905 [Chloroflexi bacterium]|nr:hypothetical protein [Chloroflexota bacterium]